MRNLNKRSYITMSDTPCTVVQNSQRFDDRVTVEKRPNGAVGTREHNRIEDNEYSPVELLQVGFRLPNICAFSIFYFIFEIPFFGVVDPEALKQPLGSIKTLAFQQRSWVKAVGEGSGGRILGVGIGVGAVGWGRG